MEHRHHWEMMEGEPSQAFAAFAIFRDLGPRRSLDEASRRYHASEPEGDASEAQEGRTARASGRIREWAQRWRWRDRVASWDRHLDAVGRAAQEKAIADMNERQAKQALGMQMKAVEGLVQIKPGDLTPADVTRMFVEGAKMERLARGASTENVEQHTAVRDEGLGCLLDEELIFMLVQERQKQMEREAEEQRRREAGEPPLEDPDSYV